MTLHRFLCAAAIAAASTCLAGPALAQPAYLEVSVGQSDTHADCAGTTACDTKGTLLRAVAGFGILPSLAIELLLADHGRISATSVVPGIGQVDVTARLRSAGIGVAGTLTASDALSVVGRLGIASNRLSFSGTAGGSAASGTETTTAPTLGVGIHYALSKTVWLGITADRTQAEFDGESVSVSAVAVGLRYRF